MKAFARICDEQGRHALLVNKGRLTRNLGRILTPVGGGLEYRPIGRTHLTALGATDFEGDRRNPVVPDLDFRVPDDKVGRVVTWFKQRDHREREITVHREMMEELTHETGLLRPEDIRGYTGAFAGFFRYDAITQRDVPERNTAYLIETFDVMLKPRAMHLLKRASQVDIARRWVYFVSEAEIMAGVTRDGVDIGRISRFVI